MNDSSISPAQLTALEAMKELISDPDSREQYAAATSEADKQSVFDAVASETGADYHELPEGARAVLEALSEPELAHLAELDAGFVEGGMSVPLPSGVRSAMVF